MPTQRKRIGFLPRAEVQTIIDQICKDNKLSQSKVTSILVEEALTTRGVLNNSRINISDNIHCNYKDNLLIVNDPLSGEIHNDNDIIKPNEDYLKDEVQLINDFIEFKLFKNIIRQNRKNI